MADYLLEHAAWMAAQASIADKETAFTAVKNDSDLAALRNMSNQEIDDWFAANVTTAAQLIRLAKKLVKLLVRKGAI